MNLWKRALWTGLAGTGVVLITLSFVSPQGAWWSGAAAVAPAQAPVAAQTADLAAALPSDKAVTVGTFANGLRYYLRANKQPLDRAELRLVVNAGSLLEDDDQRGLAHVVEHMAFNGTKHFPKQDITAFLQSIGMRFGAHVNAATGFDNTTFALQIPTNKPEVIDRALLVLEDWAHNVSFDTGEIEKERGVVIEEWRLHLGAAARMRDAQFPVLFKGSRYADRLPIGQPEVIRTFRQDRLRQFYSDWYRPDLMAIVAVGDFDTRAVEGLVRKHFASIPAARTPKPRPAYDVPAQPGTVYSVATDKEATSAAVSVYRKATPRIERTLGDYRRGIVERLASSLLSMRLADVAQRPNAPFLAASASRGRVVQTSEASIIGAAVREDGIERGVQALFGEAERVARFGFTDVEFDRVKTGLLRGMERAVAEEASRPSAALAAEYIRNFTEMEPFPGLAFESELTRRFVPEITLAEVNEVAKTWAADGNRVVLVTAPDKPGVKVPDQARLAALISSVATAALTPYVAAAGGQPLLDDVPEPGAIVKATTRPEIGITEWLLSNGARVVLKPTTFKEDEVLFRAFSPGGTSLASDADFVPARTAAQVVGAGGFGKFASGDLRRALTGKVVTVQPLVGTYEQGLAGGASRKDLDTLFQLIHLTVTQPRRDPAIFAAQTSQLKASLASQTATPDFAFSAAMLAAATQNHPRMRPTTLETVSEMNLDKSLAFYKERFGDASGFTFVFVGSFDPETLKPLVERYLASLPSTHRQDTWKDVGVRTPPGIVEQRVEKGAEPRGRAAIVFSGPFEDEADRGVALTAMADVLEERLRETLREELSGTYSVSVSATAAKIPRGEYSVGINFGSDPKRTDALVSRVFGEIARFKADGPSGKELADVKAALVRAHETNSRENGFLLTQLAQRYQIGEAPETLLHVPVAYKNLTAAMIRDVARLCLDTNRYVKVTLFPEK